MHIKESIVHGEKEGFTMNPIAQWLKVGVTCVVLFFARIEATTSHLVSSVESSPTMPCVAPEYRQFDFWIGDWDAFDFDNPTTKVAHTQVDRILDGCVLREDYQGADGHQGQSFSIYDSSRKIWHQSWVTNRGQLLVIEGKFQDGEMVLSGVNHAKGGQTLVRGIWKPANAGVRETAVTSTDGGKTWKPWFDLMFRLAATPGNNAGAPDADERIITALDAEYQAAVKRNDAFVMDRLLADDFVLVTGSGKTYNKADLLQKREVAGWSMNIKRTVRRRCALGAIPLS